jgi:hypothetical protein
MKPRDSQLDLVLAHLGRLRPESVASLPLEEVEWILANFVDSGGRRLLLDPDSWPEQAEREKVRRLARSWWPLSIASDFPHVSEEQVRTLALAATCFHLYILYLDSITDNPVTTPYEVKMAMPFVLERWFHLSARLFPPDSPYWNEVRRILLTLCHAMHAECRCSPPRPLTLDEYIETGRGRVAFTSFSTIGLAVLENSTKQLPTLCDCWTALSLAALIHDDITDWMEDYENQTYSYLHTQVLFSHPFREKVKAGNLPDVREVGIALFFSDLAESLYDVAEAEILRAQTIISRNGYRNLADFSQQAHALVLERRSKLAERKLQVLADILLQKGG